MKLDHIGIEVRDLYSVELFVDEPLADGFLMADLLFERGMSAFDAARACAWLEPLIGDPPGAQSA